MNMCSLHICIFIHKNNGIKLNCFNKSMMQVFLYNSSWNQGIWSMLN